MPPRWLPADGDGPFRAHRRGLSMMLRPAALENRSLAIENGVERSAADQLQQVIRGDDAHHATTLADGNRRDAVAAHLIRCPSHAGIRGQSGDGGGVVGGWARASLFR